MERGWVVEKHICTASALTTMFTARKSLGIFPVARMEIPKDEDQGWLPPDPGLPFRLTSGNSSLTLDSNSGWHGCAVELVNPAGHAVATTLSCGGKQVCVNIQPKDEATVLLPLSEGKRVLNISCKNSGLIGIGVRKIGFRTEAVEVKVISEPYQVQERVVAGRNIAEQQNIPDFSRQLKEIETPSRTVGTINPRPAGPRNWAIQVTKRFLSRMLSWYTRPLRQYQSAVAMLLREHSIMLTRMQEELRSSAGAQKRVDQDEGASRGRYT